MTTPNNGAKKYLIEFGIMIVSVVSLTIVLYFVVSLPFKAEVDALRDHLESHRLIGAHPEMDRRYVEELQYRVMNEGRISALETALRRLDPQFEPVTFYRAIEDSVSPPAGDDVHKQHGR